MKKFLKEIWEYNYWSLPIVLWGLLIIIGSIQININNHLIVRLMLFIFFVDLIIAICVTNKAIKYNE